MNKNEVLEEFYSSKQLDTALNNLMGNNWRLIEDFKQDLMLTLLEKSEEKIIQLEEDGVLMYYVINIILKQMKYPADLCYKHNCQLKIPKSKFYKTYKRGRNNIQIEDYKETGEEQIEYKCFDVLKYCSENRILTWHEKNLLSMYYKLGEYKHDNKRMSLRRIEKELNIDHVSAHLVIKKAIEKIKKAVDFETPEDNHYLNIND